MARIHGWPGAETPRRQSALARSAGDLPALLQLYFQGWEEEAPTAEVTWSTSGCTTRADVAAAVRDLLGVLERLGLLRSPGRVGVYLDDGVPNLVVGIAIFLAGQCQVVFPRHAPLAEIEAQQQQLECDWILTDAAALLPGGWQLVAGLSLSLPVGGEGGARFQVLRPNPPKPLQTAAMALRLSDPAFLTLSSGTTTGIPTVHSRTFLTSLYYATAGERWHYFTPRRMARSNLQFPGPRAQLITLILAGGCLCFYAAHQEDDQPRLYGESGATRTHLFIPQLRRLVVRRALPEFPDSLGILVGTDRVPMALRREVHHQRPGCLAINYSTSQCGPITFLPPDQMLAVEESVGWSVAGVTLGFMEEAAEDGAAEVVVDKTWTLALPEPGGGWRFEVQNLLGFRPGDRLRARPDGQFVFAGRANDVFLFRGVLISPVPLETFLEAQPGVLEAVAFGAESSTYGAVPMAVVQLEEGLDPVRISRELQRASRQLFGFRGLYAVHPNAEIPRGVGGKPLRRELARRYRFMDQAV